MTTIELVSIIRKRGQPTRYILMIDDEPITLELRKPVQRKDTYTTLYTQHFKHRPTLPDTIGIIHEDCNIEE